MADLADLDGSGARPDEKREADVIARQGDDLSALAGLADKHHRTPNPLGDDEALARPFVQPRIVRIAPIPCGIVDPVIGPLSDPRILRALEVGGDGWLNSDGRVIANGTYSAYETIKALGGMEEVFARIARLDEASLESARGAHGAARAAHDASGEPPEDFHFDWNLSDDYCPEAEEERAIAEAGWARISLRRDGGVKTVIYDGRASQLADHIEHLEALRAALGFGGCSLPPAPPTIAELRRRAGIEEAPAPAFGR